MIDHFVLIDHFHNDILDKARCDTRAFCWKMPFLHVNYYLGPPSLLAMFEEHIRMNSSMNSISFQHCYGWGGGGRRDLFSKFPPISSVSRLLSAIVVPPPHISPRPNSNSGYAVQRHLLQVPDLLQASAVMRLQTSLSSLEDFSVFMIYYAFYTR